MTVAVTYNQPKIINAKLFQRDFDDSITSYATHQSFQKDRGIYTCVPLRRRISQTYNFEEVGSSPYFNE